MSGGEPRVLLGTTTIIMGVREASSASDSDSEDAGIAAVDDGNGHGEAVRLGVLVGDELGIVKRFDVGDAVRGEFCAPEAARWGEPDRESRIVSLACAATPQFAAEGGEEYLVARAGGELQVLDVSSGRFRTAARIDGKALVGARYIPIGEDARGGDVRTLACASDGSLHIFAAEAGGDGAANEGGADADAGDAEEGSLAFRAVATIAAHGPAETFSVSACGTSVALGGRENNVEVWRLETQSREYSAKSPKPNALGIWDKPWISALCHVDAAQPHVLLAGTAGHALRLYDLRARRRPQFESHFGDTFRVTCLEPEADGVGGAVWCANGGGQLAIFDLRQRQTMDTVRAATGAIKGLARVPPALSPSVAHGRPALLAVGLDRFLRVVDCRTRKQRCAFFLKQFTQAVAVLPSAAEVSPADDAAQSEGQAKRQRTN